MLLNAPDAVSYFHNPFSDGISSAATRKTFCLASGASFNVGVPCAALPLSDPVFFWNPMIEATSTFLHAFSHETWEVHMPTPVIEHPAPTQKTRSKRRKIIPADLDCSKRIWSEAEAAAYAGVSVTTMTRWRNGKNGFALPANLYRQNTRGGKIHYFVKPFINWFECQGRSP